MNWQSLIKMDTAISVIFRDAGVHVTIKTGRPHH